MTSLAPLFFNERLHEYQNSIAKSDPVYEQKLKEKELDDKYKEQMMEGCRFFVKELKNINDKKFSIGFKHDLAFQIATDKETKSKYFYTGCPELKKFIDEFNSKDKNNQIHFNKKDKFVNKISVNEEDVKNGKLNYELSYELEYKDEYKSEYPRSGYVKIPDPPSKDSVFFV
jgi:hypothetical protein